MHIVNFRKPMTGDAVDLASVGESGYCVYWVNGCHELLDYKDVVEREHKDKKYLVVKHDKN